MPNNFCTAVQFTDVLVQYSQGAGNTDANSIISKIAPIVPVYDMNFQYKVWDSESAFTVQPILVGAGENPRQTVLKGKTETDTLQSYALSLPIPDALLGVNREKAQAITLAEYRHIESQFVTSYEYERAKMITSQLAVAQGMGGWGSATKNPLEDIDNAILSINAKTGKMPNTIVFGINAWQLLRANPIARQVVSFNSVGLFNEDLLRQALVRPIPNIHIAAMPYRDVTGDAKTIMENEVYILYKEDSPTQFDTSAIKTFGLEGKLTREVITEYKPTPALTLVTNRVYSLTKVTNPNAIVRIDATANI